jgi:hypothetical protein
MNTTLGCMCQPKFGAWGAPAEPAQDGWSTYVDVAAAAYKQFSDRPALERMKKYEEELRILIMQGGTAKKIAEVKAKLEQARRDLSLENEQVSELREFSDLAKLGTLMFYGLGAATILFILSRAAK